MRRTRTHGSSSSAPRTASSSIWASPIRKKLFYALSKDCVCHNMKVTTIADVLHCLEGTDGEEILLEESVRLRAKKSIDEMIRLGK